MKQAILIRKDLKMPPGKAISQGCHASVEAALKSSPMNLKQWKNTGMKKIILKVSSEKELLYFQKKARLDKITNSLIKDAAKTFFKKPTITCLAIGPDLNEKIDKLTSKLKMY